MTQPGENISLIMYEFKLQEMNYIDEKISNSDYGSHVVKFLGDTFETTFKTLTTTGNSKVCQLLLVI